MSSDLGVATDAVLVHSAGLPEGTVFVKGPQWEEQGGLTATAVVRSLASLGYQATQLQRAVEILQKAIALENLTFFVGVSANLLATGAREALVFLARHSLVNIVVLSGGAAEYDLHRLLDPEAFRALPTYPYEEECPIPPQRGTGIVKAPDTTTRVGNILINSSRRKLEEFFDSVLPILLQEQREAWAECVTEAKKYGDPTSPEWAWTPSRFWKRIGELLPRFVQGGERACEGSLLYWASKNDVPLYSPNFADGEIFQRLHRFHEQLRQGQHRSLAASSREKSSDALSPPPHLANRIVVDLVQDIGRLNRTAMKAEKTAMLVLGGGVVKHHVCNANLMRNGADFAVFVNNAQEFDGSDAGARPDEAVSWGKIRMDGVSSKVYAEASVIFPLLIQQVFVPHLAQKLKKSTKGEGCAPDV